MLLILSGSWKIFQIVRLFLLNTNLIGRKQSTSFFSVSNASICHGGTDAGESRAVDKVVGADLERLWPSPQRHRTQIHEVERRYLFGGRGFGRRLSIDLCSRSFDADPH